MREHNFGKVAAEKAEEEDKPLIEFNFRAKILNGVI